MVANHESMDMSVEYSGYMIESDGAFGLKKIKNRGSGALPKSLMGHFTHSSMAQKAIDQYILSKEKVDGEKVTTSRG